MKMCLVTGGAGFIGSHLIDALLKDYRVICADNLSTGSKKNIEHLMKNPNFKFIEHDTKKPLEIREYVDFIFHLASKASPVDFPKYPIDILLTNSLGTYNMLELAREKKVRLLLASSSEVYGNPLEHPQKETYLGNVSFRGVRSCYDEGKRFGEALVAAYIRKFELDIRTARIFNTYGPRMRIDDGRVIPNFITQALQGKPITVYGDGKQTRSFCYISDMVDGLMKVMFMDSLNDTVFNIGNVNEWTILSVAELIKKTTNSKSEIIFKPLPENDPVKRKPDITKAKRILNWSPKISLNDGLKETINYFIKELS